MSLDYTRKTDSELIELMKDQKKAVKESAFGEIYNRYNRLVYNFCFKLLNDRKETSDIFQDVFYKFVDSINKRESIGNVRSFLITISRNICINYFRKIREVNIELDYEPLIEGTNHEDKDLVNIMRSIVNNFDPEIKESIVLHLYEGFSYEEISEITGDPYSTVKNRIWRAKEKIKILMQPYLNDVKYEIKLNN